MSTASTRRRFLAQCGALALVSAAGRISTAHGRERGGYVLATATTGGTFYPVGVALATLTKLTLEPTEGIALTAVTSTGSARNIEMMRANEAHFAILQGLYGAHAWTGTGLMAESGPQTWMRSISMLWDNVEHFGVRSSLVTDGTIDDLKSLRGRKFSIGVRESGSAGSGTTILENLGIPPEETFDLAYLGYTPSAKALEAGIIDGFNIPGGAPVGAVTQAFAVMGRDLTILDFTPEQVVRANGGLDLWTAFRLPVGTYPGQERDIHTISQPNFLATRADMDEDVVYLITKTLFENLAFLRGIHDSTRSLGLDRALVGLPAPLHPGAVRYYREIDLAIPDRLITPEG
jgi:TRAP transporter TAXI family solute receptor